MDFNCLKEVNWNNFWNFCFKVDDTPDKGLRLNYTTKKDMSVDEYKTVLADHLTAGPTSIGRETDRYMH
ncbi:MAG: hypothetical protein ACFB0B_06805 [Thermonemataceae bacterium]